MNRVSPSGAARSRRVEKHMMYPEMMHILVESHQGYLRRLASDEPLIPHADVIGRFMRRVTGKAMIRVGSWLAGHAPQLPEPIVESSRMSTQDS